MSAAKHPSSKSALGPPKLGYSPAGAVLGSVVITALIFVLLPLTQLLSLRKEKTNIVINDVMLPPPPPPPPEPPPPEEEEEEQDVEDIEEEREPPSLDQLELTLNADISGNLAGDFVLPNFDVSSEMLDMIFELEELDERPRPITQVAPVYPDNMRRSGITARVSVIMIVDEHGMVKNPRIETSTNSAFDKSALDAIKKWRFTPGVKDGRKVKTRMRQPFSFTVR